MMKWVRFGRTEIVKNPEKSCHRMAPSVVGVDVDKTLDQVPHPKGAGTVPFVVFYKAEYPGMVRLAHVLTGTAEGAEDVVQDAFARILGRFDGLENAGGYLRTTVVNLCRDGERRRRRERRLGTPSADGINLSLGASEVVDVLLRLPYRQRAVLVLRYWGDWSEAEIADVLGCRSGTVKTLASRGLAHLRKELGP
jgi:RNA polymerase sigma-70 factor (sigma-E family)